MRLHQRIRRQQGRHNDDWLITYADTITLLLCMFVIILSVRHGGLSLAADVASPPIASPGEAILAAPTPVVRVEASDNIFGGRPPFPASTCDVPSTREIADDARTSPERVTAAAPEARATIPEHGAPVQAFTTIPALLGPPPSSAAATEAKIAQDPLPAPGPLPAMVERLRSQGTPVAARQGDRITTLQIGSTAFFGSGFATISGAGKAILSDVAITLNSDALAAYRISIEGHTDDTPINTAQFQSNWELSTARAAAVVRFLLEQGIPARRLAAAGYADTFPLAPNRNAAGAVIPENQARNRRVVIKLEKIDKAER